MDSRLTKVLSDKSVPEKRDDDLQDVFNVRQSIHDRNSFAFKRSASEEPAILERSTNQMLFSDASRLSFGLEHHDDPS